MKPSAADAQPAECCHTAASQAVAKTAHESSFCVNPQLCALSRAVAMVRRTRDNDQPLIWHNRQRDLGHGDSGIILGTDGLGRGAGACRGRAFGASPMAPARWPGRRGGRPPGGRLDPPGSRTPRASTGEWIYPCQAPAFRGVSAWPLRRVRPVVATLDRRYRSLHRANEGRKPPARRWPSHASKKAAHPGSRLLVIIPAGSSLGAKLIQFGSF
jgi:hypothetical protein